MSVIWGYGVEVSLYCFGICKCDLPFAICHLDSFMVKANLDKSEAQPSLRD
jgi:hypothetical protein